MYSAGTYWTQRGTGPGCESLHFERRAEQVTFEHCVAIIEHHLARRARLEKELLEVGSGHRFKQSVARLSSMRGIAALTALGVLAEVQDFRCERS